MAARRRFETSLTADWRTLFSYSFSHYISSSLASMPPSKNYLRRYACRRGYCGVAMRAPTRHVGFLMSWIVVRAGPGKLGGVDRWINPDSGRIYICVCMLLSTLIGLVRLELQPGHEPSRECSRGVLSVEYLQVVFSRIYRALRNLPIV